MGKRLKGVEFKNSHYEDRILKSVGYRFMVHKEYLIFYLVDEEEKQVNIMAIFNSKKEYMRVMKNFI